MVRRCLPGRSDGAFDLADPFDDFGCGEQHITVQVSSQLLMHDEVQVSAQGTSGLAVGLQTEPGMWRGRAPVLAPLHRASHGKHA